ncbi:acetylglucosaminyltransferase [Schizosaccharomyces japonicus yFS275]|uniref:Acetylglucosaminyltransferase n=1 Tax=Schizosaccharomyces japonicus (strain yFS275 / FY16936) TaxID=402676 RepID=B6K3G6_SCHJY|nr:acetylglucosaminyltransferase [Schizosaccharomyces japonicus yFS275]EEB08023.1 acetylglucosaminyltransferase [Schizosaccharomyces japonicus yFS275]
MVDVLRGCPPFLNWRKLLLLVFVAFNVLISVLYVYSHADSQALDNLLSRNGFGSNESTDHALGRKAKPKEGRYTYLTFLTPPTTEEDFYFNATRLWAYRLLHREPVKTKYEVHVMVMKGVEEWKIQRLKKDGAKVILVDPLLPQDFVEEGAQVLTGSPRWQHMFTKLRVFELEQFDKVCIVDSDLLILRNMDDIFDTPYATQPPQPDIAKAHNFVNPNDNERYIFVDDFSAYSVKHEDMYPYLLAATDDRSNDHPIPVRPASMFNAGLMLLKPSKLHMQRLLTIARYPYMYEDARMMEQSLLNLAYDEDGWFPWTRIDWSYNGVWCQPNDHPYLRAAHGKFWDTSLDEFHPMYVADWWQAYGEMIVYHELKDAA